MFIVRQDFPKLNFGVFPSPELQLEHVVRVTKQCRDGFTMVVSLIVSRGLNCSQVKKLGTVSKMKHELKYDMFYKKSVLEQEICFAKFYKYKAAINSAAVRSVPGLALMLRCPFILL